MKKSSKKIFKNVLIFGTPIAMVAIGAAIAVPILINKKNDKKAEVKKSRDLEIFKKEGIWNVKYKLKNKVNDLNNISLTIKYDETKNKKVEAQIINENNEQFLLFTLEGDDLVNSKSDLEVIFPESSKITENLKIDWPLYEIKENNGNSLTLNINNHISKEVFTVLIENVKNSNENRQYEVKVIDNQLKINIPSDLNPGKYIVKSVNFGISNNLLDNNFISQNRDKLTLSNYNLGKINNDILEIDYKKLELQENSKLALVFKDRNNNIKIINAIYDENIAKFNLNELDKKREWIIFDLIEKEENSFEKSIANFYDFNSQIRIIQATEKEVEIISHYVINNQKIIFVVKDINNELNFNNENEIQLKVNKKSSGKFTLKEYYYDLQNKILIFDFVNKISDKLENNDTFEFTSKDNKIKFIVKNNTINNVYPSLDNSIKVKGDYQNNLTFTLVKKLNETATNEIKISYLKLNSKLVNQEEAIWTDLSKDYQLQLTDKQDVLYFLNAILKENNSERQIIDLDFENNQLLKPESIFLTKTLTSVNINENKVKYSLNLTDIYQLTDDFSNNHQLFEIILEHNQKIKKVYAYSNLNNLDIYIDKTKFANYKIKTIKKLNNNSYEKNVVINVL
ncbi:hypothetical protein [Mesomycoplasma lagogenitalium]|uniref:DUF1410 domain-containing protein n=1 Tax=Mesomycoplasma lagogenitalium TaxID=171286 RepID=A0ABY8LU68_9BACT|nr:hypothetical protein [Mesomycoplasma lagogenitalium]WGI36270.1 hypothetical protein QEG99_02205 [Mesomycoplasma lagogenitalium]